MNSFKAIKNKLKQIRKKIDDGNDQFASIVISNKNWKKPSMTFYIWLERDKDNSNNLEVFIAYDYFDFRFWESKITANTKLFSDNYVFSIAESPDNWIVEIKIEQDTTKIITDYTSNAAGIESIRLIKHSGIVSGQKRQEVIKTKLVCKEIATKSLQISII